MSNKSGIVRVLHVNFGMDRGGMESRIMDIYRKIDKMYVQFDFLENINKKCIYDDEILNMGGKIYYSGYGGFHNPNIFKAILFIKNFFQKHTEYNIVHIHESYLPSFNMIVLYYAKKYGNKVILHSRNACGIHPMLHNLLKKFYCRKADYHFACSEKAARWMFDKGIIRSGNYQVINNAIDAEKFVFSEKMRKRMRKQLGILDDQIVVGHVGRFYEQKNHKFLIEIFKSLYEKNQKYRLVLVGDGPLKGEIINIVKEYHLEQNIMFLGARSDMPSLYQAFDIFLLPSLYEGLPGVGVEAQASGLLSFFSDRITDEVRIVDDLAYMISIDDGTDKWCNAIERNLHKIRKRRNTYEEIQKKGFDIGYVSKWFTDFYLGIK